MPAKTLKRRAFFRKPKSTFTEALLQGGWELGEIKRRAIRLLVDFRNPSDPGKVAEISGERKHSYAGLTRARCGPGLGLGNRRRHSPDAARAGALERVSAAAGGHRRLSGAVVRRLSRPQPLHRIRPLSASRRGLELLDQSGRSGTGHAVDPATDAARVRHVPAVAPVKVEPCASADHGAALARQHAADRYLCRPVGAVAVSSRVARRQDFRARKIRVVRLYRLRVGHA